jgi:hypothetical protein
LITFKGARFALGNYFERGALVKLYILQYLHSFPHYDTENVMLIGVYASRADAEAAVERRRDQPGFRDAPRIVDAAEEERTDWSGFCIDEYTVDQTHWDRGFITYRASKEADPKDAPTWAKGFEIAQNQNEVDFAKKIMDKKYGIGNWKVKGAESEFINFRKYIFKTK